MANGIAIGYGIFELPSNLVIRRIGARWWLSGLITAWGACVLGMGFIHTWQSLTALRAFLGIFEAGSRFHQHIHEPVFSLKLYSVSWLCVHHWKLV